MTARTRHTPAEAYEQAFSSFQRLSKEEKLERLRRAGVLGVTPHVGDKVRVVGPDGAWRYAIVLGEKDGKVFAACNVGSPLVQIESLEEFSLGQTVQLVQRAPEGRERAAAARAFALGGRPFDLARFELAPAELASGAFALGALVAAGIAFAAIALSSDSSWDENVARYRDNRGRFTPG